MNRGTREGTKEEILYTIKINKNRKYYCELLGINPLNSFAVKVNNHQYGLINKQLVKPKSDIIMCSGSITSSELESLNYYLDEDMIEQYNLIPINFTGISIKIHDSKRYTITKMSHNTFVKVFNDPILGCGASIYCTKQNEIIKNNSVLNGWGVDLNSFLEYFEVFTKGDQNKMNDLLVLKEIKKSCNETIKNRILTEKRISDFIFNGKGNFVEPFVCHYIIENDSINKIDVSKMDFNVTTGSGRSKGIFTIVIKPTN